MLSGTKSTSDGEWGVDIKMPRADSAAMAMIAANKQFAHFDKKTNLVRGLIINSSVS